LVSFAAIKVVDWVSRIFGKRISPMPLDEQRRRIGDIGADVPDEQCSWFTKGHGARTEARGDLNRSLKRCSDIIKGGWINCTATSSDDDGGVYWDVEVDNETIGANQSTIRVARDSDLSSSIKGQCHRDKERISRNRDGNTSSKPITSIHIIERTLIGFRDRKLSERMYSGHHE
jgi:hypothetical protein